MITEHDLAEAIAECEGQRNPTSTTCVKLAAFYTIRDKLYPKEESPQEEAEVRPRYSFSSGYASDTEFGRIISGRSTEEVLAVMDELMTTLEVLNPRLYRGVLRKFDN